MAIHKCDDGSYVISSRDWGWLPGAYATKFAAHNAFRLPIETLEKLQNSVNDVSAGVGGLITEEMVLEKLREHAALAE